MCFDVMAHQTICWKLTCVFCDLHPLLARAVGSRCTALTRVETICRQHLLRHETMCTCSSFMYVVPCKFPPRSHLYFEHARPLSLSLSAEAVLPDRALCLPTFSQFLNFNKTSLSLSPTRYKATGGAFQTRRFWE